LTVIFADITGGPQWPPPQTRRIRLGPKGASTRCSFEFVAPASSQEGRSERRFTARVAVLYRNRVLQTARLSAPVVPVPEKRSQISGGVMQERELAPSTALEALEKRTPFDAVLIVNHDVEGTSRILAVAGSETYWLPFDHSSL